MSNTPADEQGLLRDVGYTPDEQTLLRNAGYTPEYPEPSTPIPQSLRVSNTRANPTMDSSTSADYKDSRNRSTSLASSRYETYGGETAGLGIQRPQSIQQYPESSRGLAAHMFQPPSSGGGPNPFEDPYNQSGTTTPRSIDDDGMRGGNVYTGSPNIPSVVIDEVPRGNPYMINEYDNDNDNLKPNADPYHIPTAGCPTRRDIHSRRTSWLSISILMLSVYSTLVSGLWLVLSVLKPRYGRTIHSGGQLAPNTASILFALIAKTIELSFVTVFVTFLGQVLSRRSLVRTSRGVTIAEMTMRTWVIQPGFMITHFQNLQHSGLTFLGLISLTAALISMFYTTASDAIVSPQLRFGKSTDMVMYGLVQTSYGNPTYIEHNCKTPITAVVDPVNAGLTCLAYEHAGEAYHNAISFMDMWAKIGQDGGTSTDLAQRPAAPGMLFDNTTVVGSWVARETSNLTSMFAVHKRIVNNVTVSMPHAGVFAAARAAKNKILQPEELAGVGEYNLQASVVSPTMNVLCANMNATELAPLIYTTWPHATLANSSSMPGQALAWPGYVDEVQLLPGQQYLNSTAMDDVFEWGAKYSRQPPVFPMYPIEFNSLTNISVPFSDSVYMLIKANDTDTSDYTMCQLRSYLSPSCSTHYNVSGLSGGLLEAHCEDPSDPMAYDRSVKNVPLKWNLDWRNVAQEWMLSMSLNTGLSNANSSTSRLLAQLIPTTPSLPSLTPSISELLAVMAGNSLMLSATDSTFHHTYDYKDQTLVPGQWEPFNATLSSQEYTSGPQQKWQSVFYSVLGLVFLTNVFCLVYFILRHGLVTDFTEPSNLFSLAINSPASHRLDGSCGAGPEGRELDIDWHVMAEDSSGHFYIKEGQELQENDFELRQRMPQNQKSITSYSKLSTKRGSFL